MTLWIDKNDPKIRAALRELKQQIKCRFPKVRFTVVEGEEPLGVYLEAFLDIDDLDEVYDEELSDLLYDIQVERHLRVYVLPLWPRERERAEMARENALKKSVPTPR